MRKAKALIIIMKMQQQQIAINNKLIKNVN